MVKKWAAKYQAEKNGMWNNEETVPISAATVEVITEGSSSLIYAEQVDPPVGQVAFYNNPDDGDQDDVYVQNVATPVAISDHQYYQSIENSVHQNNEGKYAWCT